jgi:hypothetical protein
VNFLPKYTTSKRLRYEKQIKTQDLFRLVSLEMLHGGRKTYKQHYMKNSLHKNIFALPIRYLPCIIIKIRALS